jgi:dGTPase
MGRLVIGSRQIPPAKIAQARRASDSVQHLEFKGQMMIISVFEVMKSEPKNFLPDYIYVKYQRSPDPLRDICDYIAGMTDFYLLKTYDRLFSPRMGSVFERL